MASDYTFTFNGLSMGIGTNIGVRRIDGVEDLPGVRTADMNLGLADGQTSGSDWYTGRTIIIDLIVTDSGAGDFFTTLAAVKAALIKTDAELSFTFQLPGLASRTVLARCRRRSLPVTIDYQMRVGQVVAEFHASDPRVYDTASSSASAPVYTNPSSGWDTTAGAGVDAGWDTTAGAGVDAGWDTTAGVSGAGLTTCRNAGTVNAYPIMTFSPGTGMSAWTVTNQTTGQVFSVVQTLNTGSTLIADMQIAQTGRTGVPISVSGSSLYSSWQTPRTPFYLAPGDNVLRFAVATGDQNATCLVQWQNTYI